MLRDDLIAIPQAVWIKIFNDRMVLMCHDGSTVAIEYADSNQINFASEHIIHNFKSAQSTLKKLIHHVELPWYNKPPIIFLQILESITPNTLPLIQQAYLELGYEHARLVRLYNEMGISLDPTPIRIVSKKKYLIFLISLIFLILLLAYCL